MPKTCHQVSLPDEQLLRAASELPGGHVLDLGGGEGRNALALAAKGFDVTLVDSSAQALAQATNRAEQLGVRLVTFEQDAVKFQTESRFQLVVMARLVHLLSRPDASSVAGRVGSLLLSKGLLYVSVPGYSRQTKKLIAEVFDAAGCRELWSEKHLVTKVERVSQPVSRRHETRALARRRK